MFFAGGSGVTACNKACTPDFSNAVFSLIPAGRDVSDTLVQKYKIILDSWQTVNTHQDQ